jgi:hypothetical protein
MLTRRRCQRRIVPGVTQAMATQDRGQPPDEGSKHRPVRPVQTWCRVRSAEDGDLMTQHEQLDILG